MDLLAVSQRCSVSHLQEIELANLSTFKMASFSFGFEIIYSSRIKNYNLCEDFASSHRQTKMLLTPCSQSKQSINVFG